MACEPTPEIFEKMAKECPRGIHCPFQKDGSCKKTGHDKCPNGDKCIICFPKPPAVVPVADAKELSSSGGGQPTVKSCKTGGIHCPYKNGTCNKAGHDSCPNGAKCHICFSANSSSSTKAPVGELYCQEIGSGLSNNVAKEEGEKKIGGSNSEKVAQDTHADSTHVAIANGKPGKDDGSAGTGVDATTLHENEGQNTGGSNPEKVAQVDDSNLLDVAIANGESGKVDGSAGPGVDATTLQVEGNQNIDGTKAIKSKPPRVAIANGGTKISGGNTASGGGGAPQISCKNFSRDGTCFRGTDCRFGHIITGKASCTSTHINVEHAPQNVDVKRAFKLLSPEEQVGVMVYAKRNPLIAPLKLDDKTYMKEVEEYQKFIEYVMVEFGKPESLSKTLEQLIGEFKNKK